MAAKKEVMIQIKGDSRGFVKAAELSKKELAQINKAASRASSKLSGLSGRAGKAGKNLALLGIAAGSVAAVGFAAAIKSTINLADKYAKLSQKVNVSVESLSTLAHVAELNGTTIDVLSKGMLRLSSNVLDANRGLKESVDNFSDLGIKTTDASGKLRDTESVMLDVADRFAEMENGTKKTALAMKIFGKAGAQLIPLLNQGSKGIRAMKNEAKALGIEISTKTAKQAEQFNDDLTRLKASAEGAAVAMVIRMMPGLTNISKAMAQAAKDSGILTALWVGLGGIAAESFGLEGSATDDAAKKLLAHQVAVRDTKEHITALNKELVAYIANLDKLKASGAGSDQLKAFSGFIDNIKRNITDTQNKLNNLLHPNKKTSPKAAAGSTNLNSSASSKPDLGNLIVIKPEKLTQRNLILEHYNKLLAESERVASQVKTPQQVYKEQITLLNELRDTNNKTTGEGLINYQQYAEGVAQAQKQLNSSGRDTESLFIDLTSAVNGWGSEFADAMLNASGSFKGFTNTIIREMAKIAIQQLSQPAFNLFGGFLSSAIGGAFGGSSVLPAVGGAIHLSGRRALGGPINAGEPYLVGEKGPEIVMPRSNGTVIPNNKIGKGSSQPVIQNITIDARNAAPGMEQKIRQAAEEGARRGYMMVLDDVNRNGAIRGALA